jgi:hypothetical protein
VNWRAALKLLPYVGIALLFAIVLFQRNEITGKAAKLEAAELANKSLATANDQNQRVIADFAKQRIDNDKIAAAVASKIETNSVREIRTNTIIQEALNNDPQVRDWANVPVPAGVRAALGATR